MNKIFPIYGLILAGGQSKRMHQDKSALQFHGKTQTEFLHDLLSTVCLQVFISNRKDQSELAHQNKFSQIHDETEFEGIGPLGGILSAMKSYPKVAWLVVACDLPFITKKVLEYLITKRNPEKLATAYISTQDNLPEPLCAIYEPAAQNQLISLLKQGITCPRKALIKSDIQLIEQVDPGALDNINHPDEYTSALKKTHRHS